MMYLCQLSSRSGPVPVNIIRFLHAAVTLQWIFLLHSRFVFIQYIYRSKLFVFIGDEMFFFDRLARSVVKLLSNAALVARFISASATRCSVRLYAMHDSHDFALDYPAPLVACRPTVPVCVWRATSFPIFVDVNTTIILNNWWRFLPTRVCAVCVHNFDRQHFDNTNGSVHCPYGAPRPDKNGTSAKQRGDGIPLIQGVCERQG